MKLSLGGKGETTCLMLRETWKMVLMAMAPTQDAGDVNEEDVVWEGSGWLVRTGGGNPSFDGHDDEEVQLVHADVMWPAMEMSGPLVSKGLLLLAPKHLTLDRFAFPFSFFLSTFSSEKSIDCFSFLLSTHPCHKSDAVPLGALSCVESWPSHSSPDPTSTTFNPTYNLSRATEANRIISGLFSSSAAEARAKMKMGGRGRLDMNALLMASRRPQPQVPSVPHLLPTCNILSPVTSMHEVTQLHDMPKAPPSLVCALTPSSCSSAPCRPHLMMIMSVRMTMMPVDRRTWRALMSRVWDVLCHYPIVTPRAYLSRASLLSLLLHTSQREIEIEALARLKARG